MTTANPYAAVPGGAGADDVMSSAPNPSYAVPPLREGYDPGWAPTDVNPHDLESPVDAMRIGKMPVRAFRAGDQTDFYGARDRDSAERHAVEFIDADGFETAKGPLKRFAPNPRSVPVAEDRPTMRMAPRSYVFTRPFDQHSERQFNGSHFSMADHRRTYDIYGMEPVRSRRNTFRVEPTPWDTDIVDMPVDAEPDSPSGRVEIINLPPPGDRSWRL